MMISFNKILNEYSVAKVINAAVEYFGYTTNFKEAGYILPNGKMLDLSGKRQGGSANIRALDHREISYSFSQAGLSGNDIEGTFQDKYSNSVDMINFMNDAGAIRIAPLDNNQGDIGADLWVDIGIKKPTREQYHTLRKICSYVDNVRVALSDNKGNQLNYKDFGVDTDFRKPSWNKIRSFIIQVFN